MTITDYNTLFSLPNPFSLQTTEMARGAFNNLKLHARVQLHNNNNSPLKKLPAELIEYILFLLQNLGGLESSKAAASSHPYLFYCSIEMIRPQVAYPFLSAKRRWDLRNILAHTLALAPVKNEALLGGFMAQAWQGNRDSSIATQNFLGLLFYTGSGFELSYTKAAFWFAQSATQGDIFGKAWLVTIIRRIGPFPAEARSLRNELTTQISKLSKIVPQYMISFMQDNPIEDTGLDVTANDNDPIAHYELACRFPGREYLKKVANQHYTVAEFNLAFYSIRLQKVFNPHDIPFHLFSSSAQQNHPSAVHWVAISHVTSTPPSYAEALVCLNKMEQHGPYDGPYGLHTYTLGVMHLYGWGVERSEEKADLLFQRSSSVTGSIFSLLLKFLKNNPNWEKWESDLNESANTEALSGNIIHALSCLLYSDTLYEGTATKKTELYKKAADSLTAAIDAVQQQYRRFLLHGSDVYSCEDAEKLFYFEAAFSQTMLTPAEQGHPIFQFIWGFIQQMMRPLIAPFNEADAASIEFLNLEWYQRAADQDYLPALYMLQFFYEKIGLLEEVEATKELIAAHPQVEEIPEAPFRDLTNYFRDAMLARNQVS